MKNWIGYCWFETVDQLIKDHKKLKKHIKKWELKIDDIYSLAEWGSISFDNLQSALGELEEVSQEMCAINI